MGPKLVAPTLTLFLIAASCTSSGGGTTSGATPVTEIASPSTTSEPKRGLDVTLTDVSELVKAVESSVVTVTQTQLQLDGLQGGTEVPTGTGTGVVTDNEGHVLTNAHVISGAQNVIVVGFDGAPRDAQVVGTWTADQSSDLALLLLEDPSGLEPISIGDSAGLEVGDPVVAIGNALGLGLSVSVGILSATGRQVRTDTTSIEDVLQTDAAINPGNSGGPLLDADGRLIGINTAIAGNAQNIGFAIPIDQAVPFIDYVVADAGQPFIGATLLTVTPQVAGQFGLLVDEGAAVTEVLGGSSSADAGLMRGDIIIAIDDQPITTRDEALEQIDASGTGATIILTVLRDPQRTQEATEIALTIGVR
jgi:S1-C subfamily serine protease